MLRRKLPRKIARPNLLLERLYVSIYNRFPAALTERLQLREGRKADLEKHVKAVDTLIKKANAAPDPSEQGDEGDEGEEEQWHGIEDNHDPPVNHEDEYMDDDKFTTVTVEAVDVSRDGLRKAVQDEENEIEASGQDKPDTDPQGDNAVRGRAGSEKGKRIWTKEPPSGLKKKQKKFRYESKAERKATRHREKSGNSAKARARKER